MAIVTRAGKGTPLTHTEMDANLNELERHPDGVKVPDTAGAGFVLGVGETFGWHDLRSALAPDNVNPPTLASFRGGVKSRQFATEQLDSMYAEFHIPHDYLPGSDLFIHAHWAHNSATLTGGSVTWGFEVTYAKGHQQAAFSAPIFVAATQSASLTPHFHMIAETALSITGGAVSQLDSNLIEVDGVVLVRFYLDSNDLTDSVSPPSPFAFFVDLHYQSTNLPTLNKVPTFYGA